MRRRFNLNIMAEVTGLAATVNSSTSVTLNWNAYAGATSYQVRRGTSAGSLTLVSTVASTTWTNTGHTAATTYYYRVDAMSGSTTLAQSAVVSATTYSGSWQGKSNVAAKFPMTITHPRPDGESSAYSRYRLAPNGISWRAPICVTGGQWPFRYELVSGPAGMTLGQYYGETDYGVLSWSNPTAASMPVGGWAVSVRVTDQSGSVVTRDFTLTVRDRDDTAYFVFCDAVNGVDAVGRGSYSAPFRTFLGWYGSTPGATTGSGTATYPNRQAFYFSGVYFTNAITDPQGAPDRVVWQSARKPGVHIAMPGQSPVFDCTNYYIDTSNMAEASFCGIYFVNGNQVNAGTKHSYWRLDNPARMLSFENTFGATTGGTSGGTNSACIMFTGLPTQYAAISHCTFANPQGSDFLLNYSVNHIVCEGNTITGYVNESNGHAFYLKSNGARYVSIRNNSGDCTDEFVQIDFNTQGGAPNLYDDIEICWNRIKTEGAPVRFGGSNGGTVYDIHAYRNNFFGTSSITHGTEAASIATAPNVIYEKNVMESVGLATGPQLTFTNDSPETTGGTGYLDGTTNLLTGAARTAYLGVRGSEVA